MDSSPSKLEALISKKRKLSQKKVVTVKIESDVNGKNKSEGPPSDLWSWRKYGQKPIKGSPYPRGYYKCSTSKGCSAKKQVERSRTDASMLIITYTSDHSHPGPEHISNKHISNNNNDNDSAIQSSQPEEEEEEGGNATCEQSDDVGKVENSPTNSSNIVATKEIITEVKREQEEQLNSVASMDKTFEDMNDFFDELEELPVSSSFTSLVRDCFFDERILLLPN